MTPLSRAGAVCSTLLVLLLACTGCASTTSSTERDAQPTAEAAASTDSRPTRISSFNIQFLGSSRERDDAALAQMVADYDIVVVQELVAPPHPGSFPDGEPLRPDTEAAAFFDQMTARGFAYILSEEDTGPGNTIHLNSNATEWWVAFYKPESVVIATDLPAGFLAEDRSHNADYERVPYAFAFRTSDSRLDFVLVSVHLKPDPGPANRNRRKHELASIADWIADHSGTERDFIILGDMNIQDCEELADVVPSPFRSLNHDCVPTNTNVRSPKPFDHALFDPAHTGEEISTRFEVVDLVEAMRPFWTSNEPYPGDPYDHDEFRARYSDHDPVALELMPSPDGDDDGPAVSQRPSN